MIMSASVLSSAGALAEAEKSLLEAMEIAQTEADLALAAFNLFQVRLRGGFFETALTDLQTAIKIEPHRYALHDVDRYPIERILGVGGMGVVFLCRHKLQKQRRVVKCFWESRQGRAETVFKEAFMMSDIAGEFVPQPIDYGYVDPIKQKRAFFITEYIDGAMDGETWLAQQKPLNLVDGLQVGLQMAMALRAAHQAGILHLDLKPANILLKRTQTGIAVKIIDFGLAQVATSLRQEAVKQQRTQTQLSVLGKAVFGTLDYACPEQQGFEEYGKPSMQCDVFAFGKTLYRLFTGKHPRHNLRQRDLPNVPPLYELLEDCVEEEPQSRPKSALELIERLKGIEDDLKAAQRSEEAEKERQAEMARRERLADEQRRQEELQEHAETEKEQQAEISERKQRSDGQKKQKKLASQQVIEQGIKRLEAKAKKERQAKEKKRKQEELAQQQAEVEKIQEELARQQAEEQARKRREKQEAEAEKKRTDKEQQAEMARCELLAEKQRKQEELARQQAEEQARKRQKQQAEAEKKRQAKYDEQD
jgi:serine/threonine protein kinase